MACWLYDHIKREAAAASTTVRGHILRQALKMSQVGTNHTEGTACDEMPKLLPTRHMTKLRSMIKYEDTVYICPHCLEYSS